MIARGVPCPPFCPRLLTRSLHTCASSSSLQSFQDDASDAKNLYAWKNQLALLNGQLDKLQMTKIDAVSTGPLKSGKTKARALRKEINEDATALTEEIGILHKQINAAIKKLEDAK